MNQADLDKYRLQAEKSAGQQRSMQKWLGQGDARDDKDPSSGPERSNGNGKREGSVALITAGDSIIGRAVAVLFAREGADVAIVYLKEHEDARETIRAVELEGRRCIAIAGDVRDPAFCHDVINHIVDELGGLDVLVNNAAFIAAPSWIQGAIEKRAVARIT